MYDIVLAVGAAVCWACGYFALSFVDNVNFFVIQCVQASTSAVLSIIAGCIQFYELRQTFTSSSAVASTLGQELLVEMSVRNSLMIMAYSVCMFVGGTIYLIGYTVTGRPSLVTMISSLYVVLTIVLLLVFKGEHTKYQLSLFIPGLVLSTVGVILVSLSKR